MTNEELTKKYKELYKKKTGEDLSDEEALVKTVYQPIPKKAYEQISSN